LLFAEFLNKKHFGEWRSTTEAKGISLPGLTDIAQLAVAIPF